ncbi:MAG: sulfide/dihydroorotate dehydrogenase-like FAD/NAD-binding protein, partial [Candidatus Thermoplasmatota archaeon]|nr:sulfide/dihydroorotate dehydrogenase-like FAD/NAD-binding protein [Candidatus Thermoplasmatota archaeon]
VDGPEFDGHKVDFENLTARNKRYLAEEETALRIFQGAK